MTPKSLTRSFAFAALGAASLGAYAAPVGPLGATDRDVVRDPYSAWVGNLGQSTASSPNVLLAPNVGGTFGGGNIPAFFGGGSVPAFGLPSSSGLPSLTAPTGTGASNGQSGSSGAVPPTTSGPIFQPSSPGPANTPVIVASSTQPTIAAASHAEVPDTGTTAILLGCSLLGLLAFGRRRR